MIISEEWLVLPPGRGTDKHFSHLWDNWNLKRTLPCPWVSPTGTQATVKLVRTQFVPRLQNKNDILYLDTLPATRFLAFAPEAAQNHLNKYSSPVS